MIYCNGGMRAISDMDDPDRFSLLPDCDPAARSYSLIQTRISPGSRLAQL